MIRNLVWRAVRWSCIGMFGTSIVFVSPGCQSKTGSGAVIGGATGAAVGGVIGHNSGSRSGEGALIGGAIGALSGALIGRGIDERDRQAAYSYQASEDFDRRHAAKTSPSKQDVIDWTARGTSDDIIIDRIERSGAVFRLSASEENRLRDEGVSEEVIQAMKATARRS